MGRIAVIGAGMTGLVCADAVRGNVTVFEKSQNIGGRMATRAVTMDDGRPVAFDHGCPAIRPKESLFAGLLSDLADADAAAVWRHGLTVGQPGMRDLLAPLAHGLDIRFETRIDSLARDADGWWLHLAPHEREGGRAEGREGPFERVVLAIPVNQLRTLLAPVMPDLATQLESVRMEPCWTLMAAFEGDPPAIAERGPRPEVHWLVADSAKPGRDGSLRTWTMQMGYDWSRAHLELDREAALPLMMDILRTRTGETEAPLIQMAHRWRYSQATRALGRTHLTADGLLVGGDWALGECAEDAWASGKAMAAELMG